MHQGQAKLLEAGRWPLGKVFATQPEHEDLSSDPQSTLKLDVVMCLSVIQTSQGSAPNTRCRVETSESLDVCGPSSLA